MKREYATTQGDYYWIDGGVVADHPTPPEGEGWDLRGMAVVYGRMMILWSWQRDVAEEKDS